MLSSTEDFIEVFKNLGIKKNDNISVGSSILQIISLNKNINFNPGIIIDALKEVITNDGILMFDAFCWEFCRTGKFDYYKSINQIGSLAKIALKDDQFIRSKNPIYSFIVFGNNKKKVSELEHYSCFELNSPFGFIINNQGKYLLIDLDFRTHAYVHVAEQIIGMKHRFYKTFSGTYVDNHGKSLKVNTEMYCRELEKNVETFIDPSFKDYLKENKAISEIKVNDVSFILIDAYIAHNLMVDDIKNNQRYIYTKKIIR